MKLPQYIVVRAKRKTLRLSLRRDGTPIVYAPKTCSKTEIENFVNKNAETLIKRAQNDQNSKLSAVLSDVNSPTLLYLGKRYPVVKSKGSFFSFNGKEFRVSDSLDNLRIISAYREFLRLRSNEILPKTAKLYADLHGFVYNNITVKEIYSRFGSCSSNGNLNFSLALSAFDEAFIHFIVTHELSHLVHMNHSSKFYQLHRSIFPKFDSVTKETKRKYSELLTAICSF